MTQYTLATAQQAARDALRASKKFSRYASVTLATQAGELRVDYSLCSRMSRETFTYKLDGKKLKRDEVRAALEGTTLVTSIDANPLIAVAVEPMLQAALAEAEQRVREFSARIAAKIAAQPDLDVLAPRPTGTMSRIDYVSAERLRSMYESWGVVRSFFDGASCKNRTTITFDPARLPARIEAARDSVKASFQAYVWKLTNKIGNGIAKAEVIEHRDMWSYSVLSVTLEDGSVQKWKTQRIMNFSVYGLPFNQWPTRLVK